MSRHIIPARVPAEIADECQRVALDVHRALGCRGISRSDTIVTDAGEVYLLEVNTRIQVENDISARISYINDRQPNLLREQIRLGLGDRIGYRQADVDFRGAAIELRIVAEDTRRGFAPWIGTITDFTFPQHEWSAVYTHVPFDRPYPIPSDFDPNLALALVWGDSMDEAKARAASFIDEVVIRGKDSSDNPIVTNLAYLKNNLDRLLAF
jgi:biotin carboxylase